MTLLVGNNVANIAISSIVTVLVAGYLPAGPAVAATTVLTSVLVLVFGEIVRRRSASGTPNGGRSPSRRPSASSSAPPPR